MQYRSLPGLVSYAAARELQLELVEKRARGEIGDTVLFLEHEPVITRGRGLQWTGAARERQMPLGALPEGIAYSESERGGDLTYHGPGQLVIYPILQIEDVTRYLRALEQATIDVLATFGLAGESREGATGVWVGQHKIASLGIAVRRWVTYHGLALNVVNDLAPFHLISPCGFRPEVMTNLALLAPAALSPKWREDVEMRFQKALAARFMAEN
ncbi:MAG: lipoyl(octanoyl) transferase LipB [Bdellovibrionota bacterium]